MEEGEREWRVGGVQKSGAWGTWDIGHGGALAPVIPAILCTLMLEDHEFEARVGYAAGLCLFNKGHQNQIC